MNISHVHCISKQVSLPNIGLILQKWKSAQNPTYAFLHESLELLDVMVIFEYEGRTTTATTTTHQQIQWWCL